MATGGPETPLARGNNVPIEEAVLGGQAQQPAQQSQLVDPAKAAMDQIARSRMTGNALVESMESGEVWGEDTLDRPERQGFGDPQAAGPQPMGPQGMAPQSTSPTDPQQPGQAVDPAQQTTTEQVDPATGRRMKVSMTDPNLNTNYRYDQRDFYPNSPNVSWTDPRGVQMHVPSYGQIPMAVLASRMQQTQIDKAARQQKREALMAKWADAKTAPQFQLDYANYADKKLQTAIAQKAELFGSQSEALDYYFNDPQGKMEWEVMSKELEAVATEVLHVSDQAVSFLDQVEKGKIESSAEEREYARKVISGAASLGTDGETDLKQLIKDSRMFGRAMERSEFVKDRILPKADEFRSTIETMAKDKWYPGIVQRNKEVVTSMVGAIEAFSDEMVDMGIFPNMTEARNYLTKLFPDSKKLEASNVNYDTPTVAKGGDDDSKKTTIRGAWGYQKPELLLNDKVTASTEAVQITKLANGLAADLTPVTFGDVSVVLHGFEKHAGKWYVVGHLAEGADVTKTETSTGNKQGVQGDGEDDRIWNDRSGEVSSSVKSRKVWSKPLSEVDPRIKALLGSSDPYEIGGVYAAIKNANDPRATIEYFNKLSPAGKQQFMSDYGQIAQ